MENSVSRSFGPVQVQEVITGLGTTDIAVVFQEETAVYSAGRGGNELTDALFETSEFGEGESYTTKRTALIKVPKETTAEQVISRLAAHPNARIYRILSNDINDVLTEDQKAMIANGTGSKTLADYIAEKSVKATNEETGELEEIMDINGNVQFRSLFFSLEVKEDIDLRKPAERVQVAEAPESSQAAAPAATQAITEEDAAGAASL